MSKSHSLDRAFGPSARHNWNVCLPRRSFAAHRAGYRPRPPPPAVAPTADSWGTTRIHLFRAWFHRFLGEKFGPAAASGGLTRLRKSLAEACSLSGMPPPMQGALFGQSLRVSKSSEV